MIIAALGRIYCWLLCRHAALVGYDKTETKRIVTRELAAITESVTTHFEFQQREVVILTARLRRRYDIGMAMNESTQRAQLLRAADGAKDTPVLSASQTAALEYQKKYLQGIV